MKELFSEAFIQHSVFTQELYKKLRRCTKKLDVIAKIEDKIKEGKPINEEQKEKLLNKNHLVDKAKQILDVAEMFKKSLDKELALGGSQQQENAVAGNKQVESKKKVEEQVQEKQSVTLYSEAKVVEYSI